MTLLDAPRSSDTGGQSRLVAQGYDLIAQLTRDFSDRDDLYRYTQDVIFGRTGTRVPVGYRKIGKARRNPLANYFVNTIVAALTVNPWATQFETTGPGVAAEMNASLREHFFDASWVRQEEEAEVPITRRFTYSVVTLGEGILKTVPRTRTAWGDYAGYSAKLLERLTEGDLKRLDRDSKDRLYDARTEEYKKTVAPYPIKSIDVQPETFYYWRGEDGITLAVEHKRVPYLETLLKYNAALDGNGRVVPAAAAEARPVEDWRSVMSNTSTLTMDELWTWDRAAYLCSGPGQYAASTSSQRGNVVRAFRHRYGDPVTKSLRGPYAHCYGTTTASRLPEHAGLGVLYGFLDLFVMLDELLTIQQINAVITGLASFKRNAPPPGATLPDAAYGEDGLPTAREAETIEPGKIFPYDIGPIEMPRAGAALGDTIAQTREFIELILPKVLQGVVDTTDSGYQLALAARLGRIAFDPMVQNIRRAAARRIGFESWLIENEVGETVYAEGQPVEKPGRRHGPKSGVLAIGPDDLKGVHRYKVVLNPEDKASELVEVRKHAEMVQNQFESRRMAIEALGGNPEEVEVQILTEKMKDSDPMQQQLQQRVLQLVGAAQQETQAAADAALAQAAPQPAPGAMLGGMGQVFEPGQGGQPIAPPGPGMPGMPAQGPAPGMPPAPGLPPAPPGAPGGIPGPQAVAQMPAATAFGI